MSKTRETSRPLIDVIDEAEMFLAVFSDLMAEHMGRYSEAVVLEATKYAMGDR